jgi:hypothetical protein
MEWEKPLGLYQGAHEPLGLSRAGRSVSVSSMPLKGTGEARGKPPRGRAWLRDRMVSSHEVGFNLRGKSPLSQDLARRDSQWRIGYDIVPNLHHGTSLPVAVKRMARTDLMYPVPTEEPRYAGIGCRITTTYTILDESIIVNMGEPSDDGKESGSKRLETTAKTSDASEGSQRGHSSLSAGKPRAWRRATA